MKATDIGGRSVRFKAEVDFDGREITRYYLEQQDLEKMLQVSCCVWFTQPKMRRMRTCFTDVFFCFFAFSVRHKNTRHPFSGTAERIFMKLSPNYSGENGVCIAVPKWGLGPRLIFGG